MDEDAQGEVAVTVDYNGPTHRGPGVSTDIVEAGALACLDVLSRVCHKSASRPVGQSVGRLAVPLPALPAIRSYACKRTTNGHQNHRMDLA